MNTDAIPFIIVALVALIGLILGIVALTKDNKNNDNDNDNNNSELSDKINNLQTDVNNIKDGTFRVPKATNCTKATTASSAYNWKELERDGSGIETETGLYVQLRQSGNKIRPDVWNWRENNGERITLDLNDPRYREGIGDGDGDGDDVGDGDETDPDLCCENILDENEIDIHDDFIQYTYYTGFDNDKNFITNDDGECTVNQWETLKRQLNLPSPDNTAIIEYAIIDSFCHDVGGNLNDSTGVCENICTT